MKELFIKKEEGNKKQEGGKDDRSKKCIYRLERKGVQLYDKAGDLEELVSRDYSSFKTGTGGTE